MEGPKRKKQRTLPNTRQRKKLLHEKIKWLIQNGQHIDAKDLLESLEDDEQRYDVIKQKEGCESDCSGNTHGEGCKAGYNLLMLALDKSPDDGLLPSYIVDLVCEHPDLKYKSEIAMGKEEPEIYDLDTNSIRLAATKSKIRLAIKLLSDCLQPDHCYGAFLEVGPPGHPEVSAMASVLEVNDIESLERLGESNQREALHETLKSAGMQNNFMHQKMGQSAIEHFKKKKALKRNYLIPKPSKLSCPMALIFYNDFHGTDYELHNAQKEAERMRDALQTLGWGGNAINIFPNWTFDKLIKNLERAISEKCNHCSLFFLYITSHGFENNLCGESQNPDSATEFTTGNISEILDIVTKKLPEFLPKVLILDSCRVDKRTVESFRPTITANNILLLYSTLWGRVAYETQYVFELAKEIEEWAECNVSLQEIQMLVNASIKDMNEAEDSNDRLEEEEIQIPEMVNSAKRIVLRRYDGNENNCMHCKEDIKTCYRKCVSCNSCCRWFHPSCAANGKQSTKKSQESTYEWQCLKCYIYDRETRL